VQLTTLANTQANQVTDLVFTPRTAGHQPGRHAQREEPRRHGRVRYDFDTIKKANFGTVTERTNANAPNAKRLVFRYVLFADRQVGSSQGGVSNSGCAEIAGVDATVTLGTFVIPVTRKPARSSTSRRTLEPSATAARTTSTASQLPQRRELQRSMRGKPDPGRRTFPDPQSTFWPTSPRRGSRTRRARACFPGSAWAWT
jgi:hypothetical protein